MQPRSISAHRAQATGEHRFSIWCLNASVSLAWTALRQLPVSGLTCFGCVLGRTMRMRCCWRRFRPVASPRCCSHDFYHPIPARPCSCPRPYIPLAHKVVVLGSCRSVPAWCVVCGVHRPATDRVRVGTHSLACLVPRPCMRGVHGSACGPVLIMPRRASLQGWRPDLKVFRRIAQRRSKDCTRKDEGKHKEHA